MPQASRSFGRLRTCEFAPGSLRRPRRQRVSLLRRKAHHQKPSLSSTRRKYLKQRATTFCTRVARNESSPTPLPSSNPQLPPHVCYPLIIDTGWPASDLLSILHRIWQLTHQAAISGRAELQLANPSPPIFPSSCFRRQGTPCQEQGKRFH